MTSINGVSTSDDLSNARKKWGLFLLLGIAFIALGVVAAGNFFYATMATVFYVGMSMILAGVFQFLHSFGVKTWSGFLYWLCGGVVYAVAGVAAIANPEFASIILTLVLGVLTIASGSLRFIVGIRTKRAMGWRWLAASGLVTALAGLVILIGWPVNSVWLLGLLLAVDLIFQGAALIGFACQLGAIP